MKETTKPTSLEESVNLDQANVASRIPEVQDFFGLLQNSIRSIAADYNNTSRYDANLRPAYQALANFFERFDTLTLDLEPLAFKYLDAIIYQAEDSDTNIARRLYRDGVRKLVFRRGILFEELLDLVLTLIANIRLPGYAHDDDMVSLMWKHSFTHIEYIVVDTVAVGDESEAQAKAAINAIVKYLSSYRAGDANDPPRSAHPSSGDYEMAPDDINQTTGTLMESSPANPEEKAAVIRQLAEEDENRIMPRLITIIFKVLEGTFDQDLGQSIEEIVIQLLDRFLLYEDFHSINKILDRFQHLLSRRLPPDNLATINQIRKLFLMKMGEPERIDRIAKIVDSSAEIHQPEEIHRYLSALDEASLVPMLQALERTDSPQSRPLWRDALAVVGKKRIELFTRRLNSDKAAFVQDMLAIIGALDPNCRLKAMTDLLNHPTSDIRIEALSTLAADGNQASLPYVLNALNDSDARVRTIAARLLVNFNPPMAAAQLLKLIQQQDFLKKSVHEQMAFYAALAMTNTTEALAYFREQLHATQLLARKKLIETKCLLIDGLAQSGSIVVFKFLKSELEAGIAEGEVRSAAEQACSRLRETLLGTK